MKGMGETSDVVLDNLLEGLQVIDRDYRYLYVNDAVARHGRTTREALVGRTMMEAYPGIEETEMFARLKRSMKERTHERLENQFTFPDGSQGWFELRFEPVPEGVAILSVEITDRKRTERALKTLSLCNQTLVRATDEVRFLEDVCRIAVDVAEYPLAWIDIGEPGDLRIAAQTSRAPGDLDRIESARELVGAALRTGVTTEGKLDSSDTCVALPIRVGSSNIGALAICTGGAALNKGEVGVLEELALDLGYGIQALRVRAARDRTSEELELARQQVAASQRLEAVGRLAGGVAHDFNNLLCVILTYAGFMAEELRESDPLRADVEAIRSAGERAATLTRQLLAFSRKQVLEPQVVNLNEVVAGIEPMLRRLLGEDIEIIVEPATALESVLADPGQLEQVIMNLAVNARDAMPSGGRLLIQTANVDLDEEYVAHHHGSASGPHVVLEIADTGVGMDAETRSRIFEPFFTTKESGKGTGLGLSTVYGVVKQSGGNIWVYSEPGLGTTFKIYLPQVHEPASAPKRRRRPTVLTGDETVLLVEDEEVVRMAGERILRRAGYRVLAAANGGEALLLSEQHDGPIHLLLTDVVMPAMSGKQLAERLTGQRPGLKVLYTSGYSDNTIVHHGVLDSGCRLLSKPFSASDLTRMVRETLDE